jgi:hypothetical protein
MHLHTVVKVKAADETEAVERVKNLVTDDGEYRFQQPFDWVAEGETKISETVKTEQEFLALRAMERAAFSENLMRAFSVSEELNDNMRGLYLRLAGECLEEDNFWSTERLQFTLDWMDGDKVFYVDTDRHY